jgi:hypothetical protein
LQFFLILIFLALKEKLQEIITLLKLKEKKRIGVKNEKIFINNVGFI